MSEQTQAHGNRTWGDPAASGDGGNETMGRDEGREWTSADPPSGTALVVKPEDLTWQHGEQMIFASHGAALSERARETIRRALGELFQEAQGAEPASALAKDVAGHLGDADYLNRVGDEQHEKEHDDLNQRGQALYG